MNALSDLEFSMKRIIIIGDIFNVPVSEQNTVLNESDAIEKIVSLEPLQEDVELIIEQGVDMLALTRAIQFRDRNFSSDTPKYNLRPRDTMPRAVRRLAHKAKTENICISYPRQVSDGEFEIDLLFSAQNEFFLDHMTGFHIQGMALSEAARQAFLAVTEEFYLRQSSEDFYFVIRHQNISFDNFVFPFGAKIKYLVKDHQVKSGRQTFIVEMEISQGGLVCSRVDVAFSAFNAQKIAEREETLIKERIQDIVAATPVVAEAQPVLGAA